MTYRRPRRASTKALAIGAVVLAVVLVAITLVGRLS